MFGCFSPYGRQGRLPTLIKGRKSRRRTSESEQQLQVLRGEDGRASRLPRRQPAVAEATSRALRVRAAVRGTMGVAAKSAYTGQRVVGEEGIDRSRKPIGCTLDDRDAWGRRRSLAPAESRGRDGRHPHR